jgi:hypothetical protein
LFNLCLATNPSQLGAAIAERIPTIAIVTKTSIKVKPEVFLDNREDNFNLVNDTFTGN